jgi:Helix-turn-helix.
MGESLDIGAIRAVLKEHMHLKKLTGRQLSLKANLGASAVRDILRSVSAPRIDTLFALANVLDIAPETLLGRRVEVIGAIAGNGEILSLAKGDGAQLTVPRPPETTGELLAFVMAGDELTPAFRDGDIIYVSREHDEEPSHLLDQECLVQLAVTGVQLFKKLANGSRPGTYTLRAPGALDLENMQLAWVAPVAHVTRRRLNGTQK